MTSEKTPFQDSITYITKIVRKLPNFLGITFYIDTWYLVVLNSFEIQSDDNVKNMLLLKPFSCINPRAMNHWKVVFKLSTKSCICVSPPVLGSSGTSFGISRLFLGYKKEPKRCNEGCFRVFKGVLELPYVNICYISSHSNHVNHPFKVKHERVASK